MDESKKGIKGIIFGRTVIVVLAILLQLFALFGAFLWLRDDVFYVYGGFTLIGFAVILHIVNKRGNPDFKLVWMIPVLVFPVFGALFYIYMELQPGTKLMYKRLRSLSVYTREYAVQREDTAEELSRLNPGMGHLASYLYQYDNCPVYKNTEVTYFPLGEDKYQAMLRELKKAEKYIFLEYFIVEEGMMWNSILDILKEKVQEGVEVRFMYDGMCSLALMPYHYPDLLKAAGIQCKMFAPIKALFSSHYNNRDHRKILVIDGKVAFTGGVNLADEYINQKVRFGHWKDTAVMLRGEAVESFLCMFLEMWNVDTLQREDYERYLQAGDKGPVADGFVIPYGVVPFGSERVGKRVYLDILNTAREYVHIMTPYLILDQEMIMALTYAAKRGIEVKIIMPHIPDKKTAFALAKTYYNELLEAGVEIYEYTPGFVHAKVFTSDGEKAVVGTINLDYRSLYLHFECAALMYRHEEIPAIEMDFQETLEKCQKVSREDYKKQSIFVRLEGRILRLFAPLM
jgi:cardiolipin synthase